MNESQLIKDWLSGKKDYSELLKFDILQKYTSSNTYSRVYRGLKLDVLPELNSEISLKNLGYSYSYDFDVAWQFAEFAYSDNQQSVQAIISVDTMKHVDVQDLTYFIDIEDSSLYNLIDAEKEVICLDEGEFIVKFVIEHKRLTSSIYEIIVEKKK